MGFQVTAVLLRLRKRGVRMSRLTEYHCGVAVIKDKNKLKDAMQKLANYEDLEEQGLILKLQKDGEQNE